MTVESILKTFDLTQLDVLMIPIGVILFVAFWKILTKSFLIPYMGLIEAREKATTGVDAAAKEQIEKSERIKIEYEQKIFDVRVEAMSNRNQVVSAAKAEAQKIVEKSEAQAQEHLRSVRWEIAKKLQNIKENLNQEADKIVSEIVAKVGI